MKIYLLDYPKDPFIPGTDVPRLSLVYLGPKTPATTDDEVNRVIADLQRWAAERDHQPRANADAPATKATGSRSKPKRLAALCLQRANPEVQKLEVDAKDFWARARIAQTFLCSRRPCAAVAVRCRAA